MFSRRSFAAAFAALAGVVGAWLLLGRRRRVGDPGPVSAPGRSTPEPDAASPSASPLLDAAEALAMGALLERLLPGGVVAGAPGAADAGVIEFIDRELQRPAFAGFSRLIRDGLHYLDRVARKEHGQRFYELPPEQQDDLLARFQMGRVRGLRYPSARFFSLMHTFALEGLFGDPRHGGNAGGVAWRWIGLPVAHSPQAGP